MTAPAYLADGEPVDRSSFYALACDPQRSVVVEACAGAGKTWMLVSRILRALLEGAKPQQILAITFTRKAAGEMRQRLDDWLREYADPRTPHATRVQALRERGLDALQAERLAPQLAGLFDAVLETGRPVEIRTFHAWFAQLLRSAPLELLAELGLQPDVELIEDPQDHRADVFRRFHAALLADPAARADLSDLVARRGRSQVRKWLEAAWNKRIEFELADAAGVLESSIEPALPDGSDPAQALHTPAWREPLRAVAIELGRGGVKAQDGATGLVLAWQQADPRATFERAWEALFTQKGEPRKQLGASPALLAAQSGLQALRSRIDQHDAQLEHTTMVRLSRVLLAQYAAYKRSRGLADMEDLERCALALLRDSTLAAWVQERLDARIRHVLIDEFQDTSPLQWHALHAWLAGYAGAGGGASGQLAPGIFIVGDPKQSIYRFRRAEPRVFDAAQRFVVEALGGIRLACDHTRRNPPELLAAVNPVFARAAQEGEFALFRPHTTEVGPTPQAGLWVLPKVMRTERGVRAAASASRVWRDTLNTPRHEPEEVLRELEASRVAAAVSQLVREHRVALSDIMVLCRKRESLRLLAHALRERGLAYAAVEDHALMEAPEARDLVCVLDALVSPRHRLSLAQALRSPLFGASDADLIDLAQRAGEGNDWWGALMSATDPPSPALERAARLLRNWRAAAQQLPPHDLLDRIVAEGQLRERVAATVPPAQRAAALEAIDALLGQALTLDGGRFATPYNFVRALRRRAIKVGSPRQPDAVQLLTVHGAKGLEAQVVFVMDSAPSRASPQTATLLVEWPVDSERPRRCAFVYAESRCPPSLQAALANELQERRREELNGLYVAMTRARERLVFSATEALSAASGQSWWERVLPLATPWPQPTDFSANPPACMESVQVKVLPAWERASPAAVATAEPATQPDAGTDTETAKLGQALHRLLEWAGSGAGRGDIDAWVVAAAQEFGASPPEVARIGRRVLESPACARFFIGPALRWSGNEVPVSDAGEPLRIDRLVLLDEADGPVWWVLDYKLRHAPQALATYQDQLRRYRSAVQRAEPLARVRCAFITGAGEVVAID